MAALLSGCRLWCADCGESCRAVLTQDLEPVTVREGERATFAVAATVTSNCEPHYLWIRDGNAIRDADGPRYVTPPTTLQDDGAVFGVEVSTYGLAPMASSRRVRLTVQPANTTPATTR